MIDIIIAAMYLGHYIGLVCMIGRMLYHLNFPLEKIFAQSEIPTFYSGKRETNQPIKFKTVLSWTILG